MKRTILTIAIIFTFFSQELFAQKSFSEIDVSTYIKKSNTNKRPLKNSKDGLTFGDVTDLKLKKVALIGFAIKIPHAGLTSVTSVPGKKINSIVNNTYNKSKSTMKESFSNYGIELLLFEDLSNDQKNAINNFDMSLLKHSGGLGEVDLAEKSPGKWKGKTLITEGSAANGYLNLNAVHSLKDAEPLGELAKTLGVDAVYMVSMNYNFDKGKIVEFSTMETNLVGPNQASLEYALKDIKGKLGINTVTKLYKSGVHYSYTTFFLDKKFPVMEYKKSELISENFEGVEISIRSATDVTLDLFDRRTRNEK